MCCDGLEYTKGAEVSYFRSFLLSYFRSFLFQHSYIHRELSYSRTFNFRTFLAPEKQASFVVSYFPCVGLDLSRKQGKFRTFIVS